jgi:hypothetical protein
MALKPTGSTCPTSAFGLLFMPRAWTLARCSSFGASEARDVSSFRFVTEVVDILAIFPQGHTLVVVSSLVLLADALWIADEESPYLLPTQKSMTCLVALWRRSRTRRSALRQTLFLARCSLFHRREYFVQPACFLASLPSCWVRCLLRERMPRPVTIRACPAAVVTAASWISPRSTVACPVPGGTAACGTSTRALSVQSRGSRPGYRPRYVQEARWAIRSICAPSPSARPPVLFPCTQPERASGRGRTVLSATGTSCAALDGSCARGELSRCSRGMRGR